MPGFLRKATASQSRALGPFIDDTDFKTPKTGLTIANTDIKLVVNGGASADKNSGGATHRVNGVYGVTFDATDTGTVGEVEVSVVVASALPVFDKFFVVEAAVYDASYAASAPGYVVDQPVNTTKLGGTSQTGRDIGASVLLSSGTGTGQVKLASGYVAPNWGDVGNPTTTLNLSATTVGIAASVTAIGTGGIAAASFAAGAIDAAAIAASAIGASEIASAAITSAKFAANAIDANALATDAVTEIAAGVLSAAAAAPIASAIKKINNTTVLGDGAGTPWGP